MRRRFPTAECTRTPRPFLAIAFFLTAGLFPGLAAAAEDTPAATSESAVSSAGDQSDPAVETQPDPASSSDELSIEDLRSRGASIYRDQCAVCHGDEGEGVEFEYPSALVGDATVGELTEIISETMPADDPDQCVGPDAVAVASYIHFAFYSEAAQLRNRPPRISLARLTGRQLRQSLADLYAYDGNLVGKPEGNGLKAIYFDGERWKEENKKIERVDPVIDFDFGHESPGEGIKPEAFYIHWTGGLWVEHTGRYELVVRSTCSFVMDFGANDRTLINNHVQSGDKTEFRRTLTLTGGRVYPIKLQMTQRERKTEQPPAQISLSWVPPHGVEQVIPSRNLLHVWTPPVFALQTNLPPDDRSYGYERGIAVNRQWDESTTAAALEFGDIAADELWPRYQREHRKDEGSSRDKLQKFLSELVQRAFRGPISDEIRQRYIAQQLEITPDDGEAIRRVMLMTLKSPRFLYPALLYQTHSPSQRAANQLALTLLDSLPNDRSLRDAVAKNELQTEEQIRRHARDLVTDYRTRAKVREMMHQWLHTAHIGELTKDTEKFPGFDAELVSDLRQSFDAMLDEIIWSESSDFKQLFQADWAFTSDRLAKFYGDAWKPADAEGPPIRRSVAASAEAEGGRVRAGVLTHPFLMSGLAYFDTSSPIHRGVFLIRYVLGRTLRPPNEAFTPLSPGLHPDLTTRQRVALQTSPESCQVCHSKINPLGFTLENFDAAGRFRTMEMDKPVDPTGSYVTRDGKEVQFGGVEDLANFLAESDDSHRAFVDRAFQHFVKQPIAAYGPNQLDRLTDKFRSSGLNIRELIVEIAVIAATEASHPTKSHPTEQGT